MQRAEVKQCGEDVNERLESQGTAFAFAQRARGDEQLRDEAKHGQESCRCNVWARSTLPVPGTHHEGVRDAPSVASWRAEHDC